MKIVVFAPHPDDELVGCGGTLLRWKDEGHETHIIYISDGRAAYTFERKMGRLIETEATKISQDDLAGIRMKEINEVMKFLGFKNEYIHKLMLPDQQIKDFISVGVEKVKDIIKDADRIVLPAKNTTHKDHKATYEIATRAAKNLKLNNVDFYVYAIYISLKAPKDKRIKIDVKKYNNTVYKALLKYESQRYITTVKDSYGVVKQRKKEKFGVFKLYDLGKYEPF